MHEKMIKLNAQNNCFQIQNARKLINAGNIYSRK
jgi:hypothetical protein